MSSPGGSAAGVVTINDVIVPTADPRVPFGGRGHSGFGVTRGAEGLLEMTAPKALLSVRRGRRHLDAPSAHDRSLLAGYLRAAHGNGIRSRAAGIFQLFGAVRRRLRALRTPNIQRGNNS